MAADQPNTDQAQKVRAWDGPTRLFHWTLVLLFACAWLSYRYSEIFGDHMLRWHRWNGYAILILIVWRLLWGLCGGSTARFSAFVRWPWTAAKYGFDLLRGRDRHFLGHNPLGTYMVLTLLGLVALQSIFGLFTLEHNDAVAGPLKRLASDAWVKWISNWHRHIYYYILFLVGLHVLANVVYQLVKRDPLITAMVTGKKPAGQYEDGSELQPARWTFLRALLCLAAATAIVLGGIVALGGKLD